MKILQLDVSRFLASASQWSGHDRTAVAQEPRLPLQFVKLCLFVTALLIANPSAGQAPLPLSVQQDLLKQRILSSLQRKDLKDVLKAVNELRRLGAELPPPLAFVEAKAASETGDHSRALRALTESLRGLDRNSPQYSQALALYPKYQTAAGTTQTSATLRLSTAPGPECAESVKLVDPALVRRLFVPPERRQFGTFVQKITSSQSPDRVGTLVVSTTKPCGDAFTIEEYKTGTSIYVFGFPKVLVLVAKVAEFTVWLTDETSIKDTSGKLARLETTHSRISANGGKDTLRRTCTVTVMPARTFLPNLVGDAYRDECVWGSGAVSTGVHLVNYGASFSIESSGDRREFVSFVPTSR